MARPSSIAPAISTEGRSARKTCRNPASSSLDIFINWTYKLKKVNKMNAENKKNSEWHELTQLTEGQPIVVERVRLTETNIVVEGSFELPELARLSVEDQGSVTALVRW